MVQTQRLQRGRAHTQIHALAPVCVFAGGGAMWKIQPQISWLSTHSVPMWPVARLEYVYLHNRHKVDTPLGDAGTNTAAREIGLFNGTHSVPLALFGDPMIGDPYWRSYDWRSDKPCTWAYCVRRYELSLADSSLAQQFCVIFFAAPSRWIWNPLYMGWI